MSNMRDYMQTRTCPICGKAFITYNPGWIYKIKYDKINKTRYYCSYTCWRKAGGGNTKRHRHRDG